MPVQRDVFGVDVLVRFQVIERAAQPIRPGADRSPGVVREDRLGALRAQRGAQAGLPPLGMVGLDFAIVKSRRGVTAREDRFHLPAALGFPPRRFIGGALVWRRLVRTGPRFRDRDPGIGVDRLVAVEVRSQKRRHRLGRAIRYVKQQRHLRAVGLAGEIDGDFLARREAAERLRVGLRDLEPRLRDPRGAVAVDVGSEELQQLRAALFLPLLGGRDRLAVGELQRIGQRVGDDFGFVLVDILALGIRVFEGDGGEHKDEQA